MNMYRQFSRKFFWMNDYCRTHSGDDLHFEEKYMIDVFDEWSKYIFRHFSELHEHELQTYLRAMEIVIRLK